MRTSYIRAVVISLMVALAVLASPPQVALATCPGLPSGAGFSFGGGYQGVSALQAVGGYIQGRSVDPVVDDVSAWNMLTDPCFGCSPDTRLAQAGWGKHYYFSDYYAFAAWADVNGNYTEHTKWNAPHPSLSHNYRVDVLPDNTYAFQMDFVEFDRTPGPLGFWPTEAEMMGESHNRGDHFPGSVGYESEFWNMIIKSNYAENPANVMQFDSSPWADIVGVVKFAGNRLWIWDKRCSDAS